MAKILKLLRYTVLSGFGIFAIFGIVYLLNINIFRTQIAEKSYRGIYQLDTANSIMTDYTTKDYRDVILKINDDNTFEFSVDLPFISSDKGIWVVEFYDTNECLELKKADGTNRVGQFCHNGDRKYSMGYPPPKKGNKQVEHLQFVKLSD